jgi:hypothetical protein
MLDKDNPLLIKSIRTKIIKRLIRSAANRRVIMISKLSNFDSDLGTATITHDRQKKHKFQIRP